MGYKFVSVLGVSLVVTACGPQASTDVVAWELDLGSRSDAISLGREVPSSQYPATAGLRYGDVTVGVTCTGTLVAPSWILTAAHCVRGAAGMEVGGEEPSMWTIYLGDDNLNDGSDPAPYRATEIHVHPGWDTTTLYLGKSDLALMKLDRAVAGTAPIPLVRTNVAPGTDLILVGFGRAVAMPTLEQQLSGILRMGQNDSMDCAQVPFDGGRPEIRNDASLCAESESAAGSCARDSGGPAFVQGSGGLELAGVVSGSRNSNVGACGQYSIYAGVPQNLGFIDQYLKSEAPAPVTPGGGTKGTGGRAGSTGDGRSGSGCSTTGVNAGLSPLLLAFVALRLLSRRSAERRGAHAR